MDGVVEHIRVEFMEYFLIRIYKRHRFPSAMQS